jgi:FkbM family methyltransferase
LFYKEKKYKARLRALLYRTLCYFSGKTKVDPKENGELALIEKIAERLVSTTSDKETVFLDVGANIGKYSLHANQILGSFAVQKFKIYSFEPASSTFTKLKARTKEHPNIFIQNMGLSSESNSLKLFVPDNASSWASVSNRSVFDDKDVKEENCQFLTLDEFLEKEKIDNISMLKIDVEGHEADVLKGGRKALQKGMIDFIQFEYGGAYLDSGSSLWQIYSALENYNYVIGKLTTKGVEIKDYHPSLETFQHSNYVAMHRSLATWG